MPEKTPMRYLSIRLTETELKEVYRRIERSTCRSLTEYVKKMLTGKQVVVKVRNESLDQLLLEMINIKNRLDQLAETADQTNNYFIKEEMAAIKIALRQIASACSPS